MNCKNLEELLSAYADGELTDVQRNLVEEHLAGCADCRALLADYTEVRKQLLSLRETHPLPDVEAATMLKIKMAEAPAKLRRWLRPALVGVPIIVILAAFLGLHFSGSFTNTETVLAKAQSAMENLESYRYTKDEYTRANETDEPEHNYHVELQYAIPDRYHLIIENKNSPYPELVRTEESLIGDRVYSEMSNPYQRDREYFDQLTPTREQTLGILGVLTGIESLADENIDGTDCYHYRGKIDTEKYLDWIKPSFRQMYERLMKKMPGAKQDFDEYFKRWEEVTRSTEITHELWIGKDDYLIRQWTIINRDIPEKTGGSTRIITSYLKYYDLNEEIVIEPPLDESGELLEGWVSYTIEPLEIPEEPTQVAETPALRKPEGPQEIPEAFTRALSVTGKPETYRVMSKSYKHFNDGWNHAITSVFECGGDSLYHSLYEPTDEYNEVYPAMVSTTELVIIYDQIYTRNFLLLPKSTEDYDDSGPTAEKTLKILEMLFDIESLPDEEINGTDCYHYRGILDTEKYLEWYYPIFEEDFPKLNEMQKIINGSELDLENAWKVLEGVYRNKEVIYEHCIGKDDYLIRKVIVTERKLLEIPLPLDDLSHESTRQVITEYYDFNEEIIIEAPLDESGELFEGWVLTTLEE